MTIQPFFNEDFTTLDLASPANPLGRWRPNDAWQDLAKGYSDFGTGGTTWDVNPNQVLGGTKQSLVSAASGVLSLYAVPTPASWKADIAASNNGVTPPKCGAILITNSKVQTFGYGYYAARFCMPVPGKGGWPSFWMYAANGQNVGKNKGGAEIDLIECFGDPMMQNFATTLHSNSDGGQNPQMANQVITTPKTSAGWHEYAVDWTANYMDFYLDGAKYGSANAAYVSWFQGLQMDLRLNLTIDGNFPWFTNKSDSTTPARLQMDVDYVRGYASKPSVTPVPPVNDFAALQAAAAATVLDCQTADANAATAVSRATALKVATAKSLADAQATQAALAALTVG